MKRKLLWLVFALSTAVQGAADISPRLVRITSLPDFMIAPLRSAAESEFVRSQLAKGLNSYLEQAFPK
jgi:hypothetical protein